MESSAGGTEHVSAAFLQTGESGEGRAAVQELLSHRPIARFRISRPQTWKTRCTVQEAVKAGLSQEVAGGVQLWRREGVG